MRTIATFVSSGIRDIGDLQTALDLAMRLEFATIPPYLCAQWSIRDDPNRVAGLLHLVVGQEMQHLALVGNLLTAVGGRPVLTAPDFLVRYPTLTLPGEIVLSAPLALRPLDTAQLAVFMDIEKPEFPPVDLLRARATTIGAFYDTIIAGLQAVNPPIDPDAPRFQLNAYPSIRTVDDAVAVIQAVKQEGEGLETSPEQPITERNAYAHYYLFKEVFIGRRLVLVDGKWSFTGDTITRPDVFAFHDETAPSTENLRFRALLARLLLELEQCWTASRPFEVTTMFELALSGRSLIRRGITPQFI